VQQEESPPAITLDQERSPAPVTAVTQEMVFPVLRSTTALGGTTVLPMPPATTPALEPSAVRVIRDTMVMDTAARRLILAHKHRFHVRQLAQRVLTLALEHFPVLASPDTVAMDSVAPRSTTALMGAVTAPLGIHPPAIIPDQEPTPALAIPAILGMGKSAPVRFQTHSYSSSFFFFFLSTEIQFLSSDQLLRPWHRKLLCHWVHLHISWSRTVFMRLQSGLFGKWDHLHW